MVDALSLFHGPSLVRSFESLSADLHSSGYKVETLDELAFSVSNFTPQQKTKVFLSSLIHGNEIGGWFTQVNLCELLKKQNFLENFELTIAVANAPAAEKNVRFINRDLNRCFGFNDEAEEEIQLAKRLKSLAQSADLIFDLHQTVQPCLSAFLIFPCKQLPLALKLKTDLPMVTYRSKFSDDGLTFDTWAASQNKKALTIEMGQMGHHPDQVELASQTFLSLLRTFDQPQPVKLEHKIFEMGLSVHQKGGWELIPDIHNFSPINKDQIIARKGSEHVVSEFSGFALFPKYGELSKKSKELVQIIRPTSADEALTWIKN